MLERVMHHPAGRFLRCRACGTEPRHVHSRGFCTRDPIVRISDSNRHHLECRCGKRTARHALLALAEGEWSRDHAQLALPAARASRRRAQA